ncbi:MAG: ABC transporter permease [Acidimicrobiia bacterium]|nr:ABC transporter permease [Acidimicrobiia bacterium]
MGKGSMGTDSKAVRTPASASRVGPAMGQFLGTLRETSIGLVVPGLFILVWWIAVAAGVFPEAVLPSPLAVGRALVEWAFGARDAGPYSGTLIDGIAASGQRVLVGYSIASILGVLIGVPTGFFPLVGKLLDPLIHLLRPIPVTAWVPLSLIFFGFGFKGAVFLVAFGSFFPIVVNTIEGVRGANRMLVKVGGMLGASKFELLRSFILPASLPAIFVGLRLGIGLAWVLVIVAELMSVKAGIGYTLLDAYSFNRYDVVIAAMIMLGLMGFFSDRIIVGIQRVLLRWHQEVSIHAE